jgi:septum formation protein
MTPEVIPSTIQEVFRYDLSPEENAKTLALAKARDVGQRIERGLVIGADTVVVLNGDLLGKPVDHADAVAILQRLSGCTHTVITGFALLERPGNRFVQDAETTFVTFRRIPDEEIVRYVDGGSPFDKAGAYGIQDDYGAVFISRIEGCFYNVVGLPLSKFYTTLHNFSMNPL